MVYIFGLPWVDTRLIKNKGFLDPADFDNYFGRVITKWCYKNELPQHAYHNDFFIAYDVSKFEATAYQGQGMSKPLKNFGGKCPFLIRRSWKENGVFYKIDDFNYDKLEKYYIDYVNQLTAAAVAAARKNANAVQYAWEHTIFVPIPEFAAKRVNATVNVDRKLPNGELTDARIHIGQIKPNTTIKKITDNSNGNVVAPALYLLDEEGWQDGNACVLVQFDKQFTAADLTIEYEYDDAELAPSCKTFTTPLDIGALFNENIKLSDYPSTETEPFYGNLTKTTQKNPKQTIEVLALGWGGPNTKPGVVVDNDIDGAHNGDIWTRYKDGILVGDIADTPNTPLYDLCANYRYMTLSLCPAGSIDPITGAACLRLMGAQATMTYDVAGSYWLGYHFCSAYMWYSAPDPNDAGIVFKIRKVANGIAPAFQQSIES